MMTKTTSTCSITETRQYNNGCWLYVRVGTTDREAARKAAREEAQKILGRRIFAMAEDDCYTWTALYFAKRAAL